METRIIIEKVASGLRNMKIKPDCFLFCDESVDWVWETTILDIPVYHSALINNIYSDDMVPFIPMWKNENSMNYIVERKRFEEGYMNYEEIK